MEMMLGKWGVEGWRNENGVSRGTAIDIMKRPVISHGGATWEGNMGGEQKGELTTCTGLFRPGVSCVEA